MSPKDSNTTGWRRNQMEAALWRFVVTAPHWGTDPNHHAVEIPSEFRARVKKLLNLDRHPHLRPWKEAGPDLWAFYDEPGTGTGSEEIFRTEHVFAMGVAIDLLAQGMKPTEIVFALRHCRKRLEEVFQDICTRPGARSPVSSGDRQRRRWTKDKSSAEPIHLSPTAKPVEDRTVWMLLRREEAREAFPPFVEKTRDSKIPLILEPEFCFGLENVKAHLFRQRAGFRHVTLVEVADLALTLPRYLAEVPARRRGRPPGSTTHRSAGKGRPGRSRQ